MIDELRQIAIFVRTVDHGSFRGAAQSLRLSPSVVSHHIGQLEERLGTALLYRSTRKLSLTQDGARLLASARIMMDAAETGLQEIAQDTRQLAGMLRLTAPAVLAQSDVMHCLAEFAVAHPKVNLSIDFSDDRRDVISDGYDVAIRMGEMKDSSLKSVRLFDIKRRLVAAPGFLGSRPKPKSPDELDKWDWLELAPVWRKKPTFKKKGKRHSVSKPLARISVNNVHALTKLARAGAGLAIVPEFVAEPEVTAGNLSYVLPEWQMDPISTYAVWPSNAPRHGLIRNFIDFLKSQCELAA